ncbi:MAG: hypothetical protein KA485_00890 [Clostridia bacterium]|jgi:hypothetical protein|nr:hypothetical protein [Clostridia bacterium]MBP6161474.1 hypothetical protein [Clostridia bacterium]MBP6949775.1 hypothetical protein [Clostridia bacterium]
MRPVVLYIDDHRDYQFRLTGRLRSLSDIAYEIVPITVNDGQVIRSAVVEPLTRETLQRVAVTLCPRHFALDAILDLLPSLSVHVDLCERGSEEEIGASAFFPREHQTNTDRNIPCDHHTVSRFTRASHIDAMIRSYLAVKGSPHTPDGHHSSGIGTHLSFSHEMSMRVTRYVIDREQALGHTVIYLPIKPLYKIENRFRRGQGQTFGDLIYRFSVGDIPETGEMGRWLYMHEDGYYTCALPERSDDLITCDIDTLRQITNAWREYTHSRSEPTTSWIDIEGMPLDRVLALAVLCDFIYVDAPEGKSDKYSVARRELGLFMAKLPGECRILELPHRRRSLKKNEYVNRGKEPDIASEL